MSTATAERGTTDRRKAVQTALRQKRRTRKPKLAKFVIRTCSELRTMTHYDYTAKSRGGGAVLVFRYLTGVDGRYMYRLNRIEAKFKWDGKRGEVRALREAKRYIRSRKTAKGVQ